MQSRDQEFFRPLWRRIAVVVVCVVWCAWEIYGGDQTWMLISGGVSAYAIWTFLITFKPDDDPNK